MSLKLKRTTIFVKFQAEGIHRFPAAQDPKFATGDYYDVSFLSYPHRHIFHFEVAIQVFHDDREIEFIQFKRWMEELYDKNVLALDHKSCEMIAQDLAATIASAYPGRDLTITVSEDNENGATLEFTNAE